jgi:hypothetical protein
MSIFKVPYEDEPIEEHTDTDLFCSDMDCPCHEETENVDELGQYYQDGLVSNQDAHNIYRGKTV